MATAEIVPKPEGRGNAADGTGIRRIIFFERPFRSGVNGSGKQAGFHGWAGLPGCFFMIKATNLSKVFGSTPAVDDITFEVAAGEVLGFLGPNGAGKSTTMRMITGFIPPTAGGVTVGGHDVATHGLAARRLIGYLPENAPCYNDMTVQGFLRFCGEVRGLRGAALRSAIGRVIETCFLEGVVHKSVETLSKGYRHRTCLAQALLHDPKVLILDEPTDGLDPNQKHEVRSLIQRMGQTKAIIFSTHILEEVEAVCTRAIIIDRGRIVANGSPAELKARARGAGSVVVRLGRGTKGLEAKVRNLEGCAAVEVVAGDVLRLQPSSADAGPALVARFLALAVRENWDPLEAKVDEGRLDDVFRSITLPDTSPRAQRS